LGGLTIANRIIIKANLEKQDVKLRTTVNLLQTRHNVKFCKYDDKTFGSINEGVSCTVLYFLVEPVTIQNHERKKNPTTSFTMAPFMQEHAHILRW
jgi:hypothetical protein